jgi:hypothetical protein
MRRGLTPVQANYPIPQDFVALVQVWKSDALDRLFGYVWQGFDTLRADSEFDLSDADENLERGITQLVCQPIRDVMEADSPFYLEHHPFEDETREPAPAAPPAPDLAFILRGNPRASLPLEAKVLRTDGAVAEYVREVTENFLQCRYAPFSSQGGMLGYLLAGVPSSALRAIARQLGCVLTPHTKFVDRDHACSRHQRKGRFCAKASREFTCHHLIILFSPGRDTE